MEQVIAAIIGEILKYGAPGIAIAYLIWKIRQLELDIDAKHKRIDDLQEKRIAEAIITVQATTTMAASNETVGSALANLSDNIGKLDDNIGKLDERLSRIEGRRRS